MQRFRYIAVLNLDNVPYCNANDKHGACRLQIALYAVTVPVYDAAERRDLRAETVMREFHRGGIEDASPVRGERTVLRPVVEADVDLLLGWHADPDVSRFWDGKTFTREAMLVRLARADVTPYLVLAEDKPVGYLQVWGDREGGLDMFLAPGARGRGLGPDAARAMARHLLEGRDWTRVTVDPYAWNDIALRAWRNAGFEEVSRHEADDEHLAPWVLMEFRQS